MNDAAMNDREFLDAVEAELRHRFSPPFDGAQFFNETLFDYILDEAGKDLHALDQEAKQIGDQIRARYGVSEFRGKMRIDNAKPAIKFKWYTPTLCRKVTITRGEIKSRDMAPTE